VQLDLAHSLTSQSPHPGALNPRKRLKRKYDGRCLPGLLHLSDLGPVYAIPVYVGPSVVCSRLSEGARDVQILRSV